MPLLLSAVENNAAADTKGRQMPCHVLAGTNRIPGLPVLVSKVLGIMNQDGRDLLIWKRGGTI
jgi:hypothetical protein